MAQDLVNKHIEDAIPEPFPGRRKPKGTRAAPGQFESDYGWRLLGLAGYGWGWLDLLGVTWSWLGLLKVGCKNSKCLKLFGAGWHWLVLADCWLCLALLGNGRC